MKKTLNQEFSDIFDKKYFKYSSNDDGRKYSSKVILGHYMFTKEDGSIIEKTDILMMFAPTKKIGDKMADSICASLNLKDI